MIRMPLAGAGLALFASAAPAQEPEIFRFEAGVDLVSVPVAVTTDDGEFITGSAPRTSASSRTAWSRKSSSSAPDSRNRG